MLNNVLAFVLITAGTQVNSLIYIFIITKFVLIQTQIVCVLVC